MPPAMSFDAPPSGAREAPSYSLPLTQASDVKVLPYRDGRDVRPVDGSSSASNNSSNLRDRLPPIQTMASDLDSRQSLPSISSVTGSVPGSMCASIAGSVASLESPTTSLAPSDAFSTTPTPGPDTSDHWPSLNPLTAYYTPGHIQTADSPRQMDLDSSSTTTDTRAASVSLDDPDVRMAAEALGDLRADFVSSPGRQQVSTPTPSSEPLFSLLTTSHPLLAKTIEGTTSAYMHGKNFSPRFKSGAEYVEGYLAPIGNTIGSVSRVTGVEGGVRWFLGGGRRRAHHNSSGNDPNDSGRLSFYKRRKVDQRRGGSSSSNLSNMSNANNTLGEQAHRAETYRTSPELTEEQRRLSMSTVETLPAYDDIRSPAYTESVDGNFEENASGEVASPTGKNSAAWQSRLIMSTSGLSIAMSEESLRSLKYCLNWLKWANGHVDKVVVSLKTDLEQYDTAERERALAHAASNIPGAEEANNAEDETARKALEERIATLRGDLLVTLRGAVETVSKYAGGALPDNARVLVRKHLTSLPQRFRLANQVSPKEDGDSSSGTSTPDKDVREGAQRVLVLAKEGLDMMSQVSGVLDGTIASAEEWCERLGKKRPQSRQDSEREPRQSELPPPLQSNPTTPQSASRFEANGDVIMG
ncbi:clock controlled protein [Ophiostoma piceae UAMH 11346]|uniref:Clock controlled protein n=1 Tax=Ophiostoma piceae (strain UAMH 11346) TaxID=1262450 RepID=S3BNQ6_OPHP1|nr:clock controlled protein [Ophiostoma piceae UAMH 11346]